MFRENYKSAMNDIETNKELLNSLLEKADAENIPQNKKTKIYVIKKSRIYALSGIAAAAAVMIVSLNAFEFSETVKNEISENDINYAVTSNVTEKTENNETEKKETIIPEQKNEKIQKPAEEPVVPVTENKEIQPNRETETVKEDVFRDIQTGAMADKAAAVEKKETENIQQEAMVTEAVTETADESAAEMIMPAAENDRETAASSGGGGSSAKVSVGSRMTMPANVITEEWTKKQYYSHIGINIEEIAAIPSDMENQTEGTVYIVKDGESGEIKNDYFNFYFTGENGRYLSIATVTTVAPDSDWEKNVSDVNYMSAQSVKNGTQISVECYMLTEEEQNALINSLR